MKYAIVMVLLIAGFKSIAQKNNNTGAILEINPYDNGIIKQRLPYGSMVKFRITNVNPFRIDGTNSITKESISFDIPAQFSQSLTQSNENTTTGSPMFANDTASIQINKNIEKKKNSLDSLTKLINIKNNSIAEFEKRKSPGIASTSIQFSKEMNNLSDEVELLNSEKGRIANEIETLKIQQRLIQDTITDLKKIFIINYNGFVSTLNKLSLYTSVDSYIDSLLQETFIIDTATLKANLRGYMMSINDDDPNIERLRGKSKKALEDLDQYYIKAKGAYNELAKKINNEKVILKDDLGTENTTAKLKIGSAFITLDREKVFEKEFQFLNARYDVINDEKKRTAIINTVNSGVNYYNSASNRKFEVYTDAQQLNDDKITITPKLKNAKGDIIKEYNPVEIKTYGGWKVDFSSGYLLSFKGDENYTNLYDTSGIIGVQKNKTDNLRHSIGALLNAYPRTGRDVNVGFSFGISLPTDGTNIGFFAGGSLLMLEKNRLVLTAGVAYNKIRLLNTANLTRNLESEKISGKETYKFSNTDYKEINYDNVYRPAFFLGITYNTFSMKK